MRLRHKVLISLSLWLALVVLLVAQKIMEGGV